MNTRLDSWQIIETLIKWSGENVNSFARSIGLPRGENLYQIRKGNNKLSRNLAAKIIESYPEVSMAWVMTGEGEMLVVDRVETHSIPFYRANVEETILGVNNLSPELHISLPNTADCTLAMVYLGRAMENSIPAGSIVVLRPQDKQTIISGNNYLVICKKIVTLRQIRFEGSGAKLRLSAVDSETFDDITINRRDIVGLYHVKAVIINQ